MLEFFKTYSEKIFEVLIPAAAFLAVMIAGFVFRRVLFKRLSRWAENTTSQMDDIIIKAVKGPFMIWSTMLGLYIAMEISSLPEDIVALAGKILLVLGITSVTLVIAGISTQSIRTFSSKIETAVPVTSLTQHLTRIVIFAVGIMIILNSLGIPITPILATLGVGGLAVALALQDTLANLFSGFYIILSRQLRVGDYIKLESGEEGYVTDINWRMTKIRMLPNNVVLIPNDKLIKSIIINYYLPEREMAVLLDLGVHYGSDLEKVERVTVEVAKEVMKTSPGGVADFEPFIRYNNFGESSINFSVIMRAKEYVDQYLIKHEFIKRLHKRFAKEGIVIPYPIRAINYSQEKAQD
jgi:small-conductance mechanosensitive channel